MAYSSPFRPSAALSSSSTVMPQHWRHLHQRRDYFVGLAFGGGVCPGGARQTYSLALKGRRPHPVPIRAIAGRAEPAVYAAGEVPRAGYPAAVLAIGTANPPTVIHQGSYPDYFFSVTGNDHLEELKRKFQRICDHTAIKKRHTVLTKELLLANPSLHSYSAPSMGARQELILPVLLEFAEQASTKALSEWGRQREEITHLVFCTSAATNFPGIDVQLVRRLGLRPSVRRVGLYMQGCFGGVAAVRVAKDIAENNRAARILVVCSETAATIFRGPDPDHVEGLVSAALFGDGAAALVIGVDVEADGRESRPVFEILSAFQAVIPGSERCITGELTEAGLTDHLSKDLPAVVGRNVEACLLEALEDAMQEEGPLPNGPDWNSLFWLVHPGGRAVLDQVEERLFLNSEKLRTTRKVMENYGNMGSATVLFVMDEMRQRSAADGKATTGDGMELGMLLAFGPGVTVDAILLRSGPTE